LLSLLSWPKEILLSGGHFITANVRFTHFKCEFYILFDQFDNFVPDQKLQQLQNDEKSLGIFYWKSWKGSLKFKIAGSINQPLHLALFTVLLP
jgi:hypothetical protein